MTAPDLAAARSLLFVPGDRPERFAKAAASGADAVVLDLEDAVAAVAKSDALAQVVHWLSTGSRAIIRINAVGTPTHAAEVEALAGTGAAVMLPKTESAVQVADVHRALGGAPVLALVETPVGIRDVDEIARAEGLARLALGTVDLAADLGVDPSSYAAFAYSRSRLVIASAAAGLAPPIDGVTVRLDDPDVLAADLAVSRELGLSAKLCIHPQQVAAVNEAFTPTQVELDWAARIVAAVEDTSAAGGDGVMVVDGTMVDAPVVTRARRLLSRATPRP
ncbi:CoA ester lyase [Nocardioides panacihumi]|uniref:CoA ester lyase n=1 Tax=Nocardioides panacihumi TaxID=400774 RepID=A0ABN2QDB0_9ACTN